MVLRSQLEEALESGHRATDVLRDMVEELAELSCEESFGFEGFGTYPDCGKCVVCISKNVFNARKVREME